MSDNNRDVFLTVRVTRKIRSAFHKKAKPFGGTSEVLHEFVEAFLDDRIAIQPNPKKESLYVTRNEN
jgi:hypothetical protein